MNLKADENGYLFGTIYTKYCYYLNIHKDTLQAGDIKCTKCIIAIGYGYTPKFE